MQLFQLVRKLVIKHFIEMRWYTVVLAFVFYCATSWMLLWLCDENALIYQTDFIYWIIVTGSTVGYGDLSPQSSAGKLVTGFFVIPFGLSLFALVVGRVAAWVSRQWFKGIRGLRPVNVSDHIIVIGWNQRRTLHLLNLLIRERADSRSEQPIVLVVKADIDNPMPNDIKLVKVSSFNQDGEMNKACVATAATIIVDNPEDDVTMTTALYCHQSNPTCHLLVYFNDESLSTLLKQHCPNVECTPSVAVEMLAKSAFDPGSSTLHHDLLNVEDDGQAQYSVEVPSSASSCNVEQVFLGLKQHYDATLIGIKHANNHEVELNPAMNSQVMQGDKLFYIANRRLVDIQWERLYVQ